MYDLRTFDYNALNFFLINFHLFKIGISVMPSPQYVYLKMMAGGCWLPAEACYLIVVRSRQGLDKILLLLTFLEK